MDDSPKPASQRGVRFHLTLGGQTADLINTLVARGYKPKEVIYDALTILDFAIQEIAAGKTFGSVDREKEMVTELATPILREVSRNPEWLTRYLRTYASSASSEAATASEIPGRDTGSLKESN